MFKRISLMMLCLYAGSAFAQPVRVELEFDQETYLPQEELLAVVKIYNSSGQTLQLGKNNEWLSFSIEASDGRIVKELKAPEVQGDFTLPSAHRAKKSVDLSKAYDLTRFGRFNVIASVRIEGWGESFSSRPKHFGITQGVKLWEQAFGIPSEKDGERPEIRKYQVVQANNQKHLYLYVRITDESESYTYSIFPVGQIIAFSRPEPQLDRFSNLHLLYQNEARSFRYTMVTPDGMLLKRQSWNIVDGSRPILKIVEEGRIEVAGGARQVRASDLPPPELLSEKAGVAPENSEADKAIDATEAIN